MLRAQPPIVKLAFEEVADGIAAFGEVDVVARARVILAQRFASIDAIGPASVAVYRRHPLGSSAADEIAALAFARVDQLLRRIALARS